MGFLLPSTAKKFGTVSRYRNLCYVSSMALATKQPESEGTVGRFANFKAIFILIEAYARISPDL